MDPTTKEKEEQKASPTNSSPSRLSCTKCFDALWFCYSPFHQMQQYYRYGEFDTCFGKWNALFDCLSLKTKRSSEIQVLLMQDFQSRYPNCLAGPGVKFNEYVKDQGCPGNRLTCARIKEFTNIYHKFYWTCTKCKLEEILEAREKAKPHIWTYRTVEEASENWWRMYKHYLDVPPKPDS